MPSFCWRHRPGYETRRSSTSMRTPRRSVSLLPVGMDVYFEKPINLATKAKQTHRLLRFQAGRLIRLGGWRSNEAGLSQSSASSGSQRGSRAPASQWRMHWAILQPAAMPSYRQCF